jgi:long-chain acyl-CoA synthetase
VAYILADSRPRALFVGRDYLPLVEGLAPATEPVVLGGAGDERDYRVWRDQQPAKDLGEPEPENLFCLLYTSGTTGRPKGVMLTHRNVLKFARRHRTALRMTADSVHQMCTPLFHISGLGTSLMSLDAGAETVLIRDPLPATVLNSLVDDRITHAGLVPAMMAAVLALCEDGAENSDHDLSRLEMVLYGAAPMTETVLRRALDRFGCGFVGSFGLTESSGGFAVLTADDHDPAVPHRLRSVGRPFPGMAMRLVDPDTLDEVAPGETGEIQVRGSQVMVGYWEQPGATAEALLPGGWLRTGDAGYLDPDGYLYLRDRLKDMIISGGENVYPVEVENVLAGHPGIAEVAVVGVPHERWGEIPKAFVVQRAEAGTDAVSADEIIAFARERLAGYKCPTSVEFLDALPRNAAGKVLKRDLRGR